MVRNAWVSKLPKTNSRGNQLFYAILRKYYVKTFPATNYFYAIIFSCDGTHRLSYRHTHTYTYIYTCKQYLQYLRVSAPMCVQKGTPSRNMLPSSPSSNFTQVSVHAAALTLSKVAVFFWLLERRQQSTRHPLQPQTVLQGASGCFLNQNDSRYPQCQGMGKMLVLTLTEFRSPSWSLVHTNLKSPAMLLQDIMPTYTFHPKLSP